MMTFQFSELTERAQRVAVMLYAPAIVQNYVDACYYFNSLVPHRFNEHGERIA